MTATCASHDEFCPGPVDPAKDSFVRYVSLDGWSCLCRLEDNRSSSLLGQNICFAGDPEPIRPLHTAADLLVAPMMSSFRVPRKIVEHMPLRRPIVSTTSRRPRA
jgi:hypothetical protein